ncbi:MAG: cytochrome c peroxidase [Planctomycetaceae bacterium]|nr:cytochrome c peroxidase [Planctomycetaceae bacterium]
MLGAWQSSLVAAAALWMVFGEVGDAAPPLSRKAALGKRLFNELKLSEPDGQSCASCHSPSFGFTDPDQNLPVSEGAISGRFGSRSAPSAAYASFSPPLFYNPDEATYVGGQFWDGRADDLVLQAQRPFLNPLEMHNANKSQVILGVLLSGNGLEFARVYGLRMFLPRNTDAAFVSIADAIAAFEQSAEVNQFTSKLDFHLKGQAQLTAEEALGKDLFNNKAGCANCHTDFVVSDEPGPLFTDFTYHNLGIPKNFNNPFLSLPAELNPDGVDFIDVGLAKTVAAFDPPGAAAERGKFKTPTLRNVAVSAPYGHNGFFATLKDIVHFYNTRDVPSAGWGAPEVPENVNQADLGDLGLTEAEEDALVAFLLTLTDGYQP